MKQLGCVIGYWAALLVLSSGCKKPSVVAKPFVNGQVEVAPGVYATVEARGSSTEDSAPPSMTPKHALARTGGRYSRTTELRIVWEGSSVHWHANSFPVTLRAYEGRLYLIAYDDVTLGFDDNNGWPRAQFRYYAQEGSDLREISPAIFPRAIAGQNMSFTGRHFMSGDRQRDSVQIARDLDPDDQCFRTSLTAKMWYHLVTGQQYYEAMRLREVDRRLLQDFLRTNNPIKLSFDIYFNSAVKEQLKAGNTNRASGKQPSGVR